jgi:hypothetical protein
MKRKLLKPRVFAEKIVSRRLRLTGDDFAFANYLADILNVANCGGTTSTLNTGVPLCDVIRDIPYGLILLDSGVTFNSSERASISAFVAALQTATLAARGSRAYPIWDLTNFEDQSKEPTKGAVGNLSISEIQLVEAVPAFSFQHRKGDFFHKQLALAEAGGFTILIVDKKYAVYGTQTSGGDFAGFTLAEFKAQLPKFQTPQNPSNYPFSVVLNSIAEYKENLAIVQADSSIVNISGLRNVTLTQFSMVSNVLKVALTGAGGKNIAELFSSELTQAGVWIVLDSTGASVTVSPAYDSTNKVIALTLSGTPWTGASTGAHFTANLAAASVLAALTSPISGYESVGALAFVKP